VKTAICDVRDRLNPGEVAGFTTGWGQYNSTGFYLSNEDLAEVP
jgi:hypothetical protein